MSKNNTLNRGFMPHMAKLLGLLEKDKFSDMGLARITSLNTDEIRQFLMDEIVGLASESPNVQSRQLQKIFDKVFSLQPSRFGKDSTVKRSEQRVFADIVLTPGLFDIDYVRAFLRNKYVINERNYRKYQTLSRVINFRKTLSENALKNFDYCYRSSHNFACLLVERYDLLTKVLNDHKLSMFEKEDLSLLFRFFDSQEPLTRLLFQIDEKALFVIAQMCDIISQKVGHTNEFLFSVIRLIKDNPSFVAILDDYYESFIGNRRNETKFKNNLKDDINDEMKGLLNYIVAKKYNFYRYVIDVKDVTTISEFMDRINAEKMRNDCIILGEDAYQNNLNGSLAMKSFPKYSNTEEMFQFKNAIFNNIYGINIDAAKFILQKYGMYMSELEKSIDEKDRPTFEILKSIEKIFSLKSTDTQKIVELQQKYLLNLQKHSSDDMSIIVLEGLLNRMYMNTYNKILFDANKARILCYDSGVPIIESGLDFNMIVTAIDAKVHLSSQIEAKKISTKSIWNTSMMEKRQGICTSFINNENLGTISLNGVLLGFNNIPQDSLNMMGPTDIYSLKESFSMRFDNKKKNVLFVPGPIMKNETRYGYNEILLDRFLYDDQKGIGKLQPSYVVYYETERDYQKDPVYVKSLKVAKDFGVPLVLINFEKIQENEKKTLDKMTNDLFSSNRVDEKLLSAIMTRYMNNYSGTRTIFGPCKKGGLNYSNHSSFPSKDLNEFVDKVLKKCFYTENREDRNEWRDALAKAYYDEERKYAIATNTKAYNCSIGYDKNEFILKDKCHLDKYIQEFDDCIKDSNSIFISNANQTIAASLISISNELNFNTIYETQPDYAKEDNIGHFYQKNTKRRANGIEEKLIVAYLFDNYDCDLLNELEVDVSSDKLKMGISSGEVPFIDRVRTSPLFNNCDYDFDKLSSYVSKIVQMDDEHYLEMIGKSSVVFRGNPDWQKRHFLNKKREIEANFEPLDKKSLIIKNKN